MGLEAMVHVCVCVCACMCVWRDCGLHHTCNDADVAQIVFTSGTLLALVASLLVMFVSLTLSNGLACNIIQVLGKTLTLVVVLL